MSEIKEIQEAFLDQLYVRGFVSRETYNEAMEFYFRSENDLDGQQGTDSEPSRDEVGQVESDNEIESDTQDGALAVQV